MISGLSLEYAQARIGARLAQRPDERLWQHVRSARSVPALLETVRSSVAAATVSGIPATGDGDAIELAFRLQWRTRVEEVACWSPETWRSAVGYTRFLCDLPALAQLLSDERPPRWISEDPELARFGLATLAERRVALDAGPLAPVAAAIRTAEIAAQRVHDEPLSRTLRRLRHGATLHPALNAWEREWRARWPDESKEFLEGVERVAQLLRTHLLRFGGLSTTDAPAARQALAARLATHIRRTAVQPAALFAYLALFALDLERLRGELVLRARALGSTS